MQTTDGTIAPAASAAEPPAKGALAVLPRTDAPIEAPLPAAARKRNRRLPWVALVLILGAAGGGGWYWWHLHQNTLPAGIAWSNGRLEAEEIDIATKFAGRVAELLVDEGAMVDAGQVVARMDTRDLEASLAKAQAQVDADIHALEEAHANLAQAQSQATLAGQELARASTLLQRGFGTQEAYDQRRQARDAANAAARAATERVSVAEHALDAARRDVELYKINIADNTLVAPRDGRIQYRLSNVGEVLAAGGKVFTMLDIHDVYMDIYLPTAEAGRVAIGSDSRIVLDAYPGVAVPAKVTFLASQAQFTPKAVETKSERDKLMFRVKVQIDPGVTRRHAEAVRVGLPGLAYVRTDPKVEWPPTLQPPANL